MVKMDQAANTAGFDIRRRVDVPEGSSLQFAARRGSCHAEKAVRRLHHPPPDGFAKLLGGENFGSSIPALHFGGKTAPTRPFHGYAQSLLTLGFRFRDSTSFEIKAVIHCAKQSDAADGLMRTLSSRGPVASGRLTSSTRIAVQASIDVISIILITCSPAQASGVLVTRLKRFNFWTQIYIRLNHLG